MYSLYNILENNNNIKVFRLTINNYVYYAAALCSAAHCVLCSDI